MKTTVFNKANAFQEYNDADEKGKQTLKNIFGEQFFLSIMDRIKTWEDAAKDHGIDPVMSIPFLKPINTFQEATNAFFKLDVIATVLNEGVVLDWANENQKKWYCWFNNYKPGSGFSFHATYYDWSRTITYGGARLCVHSQELAKYFGTQFLSIFNQFLNPTK